MYRQMKDEFREKMISEFVGLKSKMYSLSNADDKGNTKAKGVNKNVVRNIRHKEYIDVLFNEKIIRDKMKRIQCKLHKVEAYEAYLVLMMKGTY